MPTLEQVLKQYPNEVKLVLKNFPLRNHKFAMKAAAAALAARRQGKFWEFHDALFENYNKLNDEKIKGIVTQLEMNETAFEAELKKPLINKLIGKDLNDGRNAGVRGTPTAFINGRRVKDRSIKGIQAIIDKELEGIKARGKDETGK